MSIKKHEAQTFTFEVDERYNASEREAIAEDVIDKIVDRTLSGKDKENKPMARLSKQYKEFKKKAVGTTRANLQLSGDMLGSLRFIKSKSGKGKITVGFSGGTEANAKAKGHITGDVGVVRDFLGLTDRQIKSITNQYPIEDKEKRKSALEAALALREKLRGKEDV